MTFLLSLTALLRPLSAHSGAVVIAVPVDGITVDGDLSDWPNDLALYPIGWSAPQGADDFQGSSGSGTVPGRTRSIWH